MIPLQIYKALQLGGPGPLHFRSSLKPRYFLSGPTPGEKSYFLLSNPVGLLDCCIKLYCYTKKTDKHHAFLSNFYPFLYNGNVTLPCLTKSMSGIQQHDYLHYSGLLGIIGCIGSALFYIRLNVNYYFLSYRLNVS